jgi:hypothetical protein
MTTDHETIWMSSSLELLSNSRAYLCYVSSSLVCHKDLAFYQAMDGEAAVCTRRTIKGLFDHRGDDICSKDHDIIF